MRSCVCPQDDVALNAGWRELAKSSVAAWASAPRESQPVALEPLRLSADEELAFDRILILTDASSSMYTQSPAQARALTESMVAGLPDRSTGVQVGATAFGGSDRRSVPIALVDRAQLLAFARSIQPMGGISGPRTGERHGGTTPLDDVFDEAAQQLRGGSGRAAVILISDGAATLPDRARAAAGRLVAEHPAGALCVFTVRLGDSAAGGQLAREVSELSGCGSSISAERLRTAGSFGSYRHSVFAMQVPRLPPVAAPPPCETRLNLANVEFDFDRADLTASGRAEVARIGGQLNDCRGARLEIDGYADSTGAPAYNVGLSERRANSVREAMLGAGVAAGRLSTRGFGSSDPVASNATEAGRERNRRVQFKTID